MENDGHNDVDGYCRIELITGTAAARRRSVKERARIVAESFEPGANVTAVARRHRLNVGLLHSWRKLAGALVKAAPDAEVPTFVPILVSETAERTCSRGHSQHLIEIDTGGAVVRMPSGVDVVLSALRRAS